MQIRTTITYILQLAAIVMSLIGLLLLFWPANVVQIFDGQQPYNDHFIRFIGTALIGFAVANWLYSRMDDARVVLPAIYGNLTSLCLAIIIDLVGLLQGILTRPAWLILLLHVVFAAAFGYCAWLIKRKLI